MSVRGLRTGGRGSAPGLLGDRRVERRLALLGSRDGEALSVCGLREHGIDAPAHGIFELQLAGSIVDRVTIRYPGGRLSFRYRLGGTPDRVWPEGPMIAGGWQ